MSRFTNWWAALRSSYWVIPTLFVAGAIALATLLVELEPALDLPSSRRWMTVLHASAEGSRSMLAAIAGSMITVAGVVYSITIVSLSLASSQYSSRVLRNFMLDTGNKLVLGVFVGVFVYCLVVLRALDSRSGHEFVPSLAVTVGGALAIVAIGFLIYFIHHVSTGIQASHILDAAMVETARAIDRLYPEALGEEDDDERCQGASGERARTPILAVKTGYVQHIDFEGLAAEARANGWRLALDVNVGSFVVEQTPVGWIESPAPASEEVSRQIHRCVSVNVHRTIEQDPSLGIRQMVDVALKALSPGVNDTTTAVMCIERLTAVLVRLRDRRLLPSVDLHESGVSVPQATFDDLLARAFDQIRRAASGNVALLDRLVWALDTIASGRLSERRREALQLQRHLLIEAVDRTVPAARDRATLRRKLTGVSTMPDGSGGDTSRVTASVG